MLFHLEIIDLSRSSMKTNLETLLPNTSNALPRVNELYRSGNSIPGSIPSALGQLTTLRLLDLSGNELTSTIPSKLGQLTELSPLGLAQNDLSETLPEQLGELLFLTSLVVEDNTNMESLLPGGFCEQDHAFLEHLSTDWCRTISQCCGVI